MLLLCLDTATSSCVVALVDVATGQTSGVVSLDRAQGVLTLVDEVLAGRDRSVIEGIVVGTGPGGFTGLRVGVATARGLAESLGVQLYGMSSMQAVEDEVPVLAAGRGERFVLRPDGGIDVVAEVEAPDPTPITPTGLAQAGARRWRAATAAGEPGDPLLVVPSYGREPDAAPRRMNVVLDVLGHRDLDRLHVLEERCFDTPWTRAMYAQELDRPAGHAVRLAARDADANGRLVGAALAARIGDAWHVMNVLVDPGARGRGIGSRLVLELVERTRVLGAGSGWTLEVRDGNQPAIALYERHGFEAVGRRRGYYADTGEDALVMWRYATSDDVAPVRA